MKALFPLRTGRGLNSREQHFTRARRVQAERWAVQHAIGRQVAPAIPVIVTMWRISPSTEGLDRDNLAGALKAVRDQVAAWLKRDDAHPTIDWQYRQATAGEGVWMVGIDVEPWLNYVELKPEQLRAARVPRLGEHFLGFPVPKPVKRPRRQKAAA